MKPSQIEPSLVMWHRLIQGMPIWADNSPEMAALVEDVRERGIDQPVIVCRTEDAGETPGYKYLLDGRHRHRAATLAGLDKIPFIERDEDDALGIIFSSITQRRHFGKGALAYLLYPVMSAKAPGHGGDRKSKLTESTLILDLCVRAGFSRDLYFQAKALHEAFAKRADLREDLEPRILVGDIGLGACLAGIAGKDATEGKTRTDRAPEQLIFDGFADLKTRFSRWEKIEPQARRAIAHEAADVFTHLPEEVQDAVLKALRAARKNQP